MKTPQIHTTVMNRGFLTLDQSNDGIVPQGCDSWKRARCTAKMAAVAAACAEGPTPWCFGAIVAAGDCCDCLPGALRQYCD